MDGARVDGAEVVAASQALREWAAGLRHWSRTARRTSTTQRERAVALGTPKNPSARHRVGPAGLDADVPSLGQVGVAELHALLVDLHGFSRTEGARALTLGLLVAGYPADNAHVSGVDALEIVEHALRHRL